LAEYNLWRRGGLDEMSSSHTPVGIGTAIDEAVDLLKKYDELERDELRKLRAELDCSCNAEELLQVRSENAALRHTEENLASTVRGLEFELEKANAALDLLNTHCMSADPIMGRSTYRWTIEHDEPDIRVAIAELRKAQV